MTGQRGHRFERPAPGLATPVRFPDVTRHGLDTGVAVWAIPHTTVPAFSATLVVPRGTAADPLNQPGLATLTGDLIDEGAGGRDALQLAEAVAQMGAHLEVEVGPDASSISVTALTRFFEPALAILADVVARPALQPADFVRVRDLRLTRLRQLSRSASTIADRVFIEAVFGTHGYGHGGLGHTSAVEAMTLDDVRQCWSRTFVPAGATLIVVGDLAVDEVTRVAGRAFADWRADGTAVADEPRPSMGDRPRILLVDKPGAPQSELRVGHLGPTRTTPDYHTLVVLNAILGGQFTSRINQRLREEKGVTYGARTAFEFRRSAGAFSCDTSVQADATAGAVADVIAELDRVRREDVPADELARARASLTRGYVRHFETAGHLARAAAQLAVYGLDDRTFDRFVPRVETVSAADIREAAGRHLSPDRARIVIVGDAASVAPTLDGLGQPVEHIAPLF